MLARDLIWLEELVRREHPSLDVFQPSSSRTFAEVPEVVALADRLPPDARESPPLLIKLVLQALRLQQEKLQPRMVDATFVATLPFDVPSGAASTAGVVAEMLRDGAHEVIALGYAISSTMFLDRLRELSGNGTRVTLIVDEEMTPLDTVAVGWPAGAQAAVYAARAKERDAPYKKMHVKALLVDKEDFLLTSANLTFHGLHGNIELGVRLKGPPAAEARRVLDHLVARGAVERLWST